MPELHPTAAKLLDRMTGPPPAHSRFVGEPIDLAELDALALGDLWTAAHAICWLETDPPPHTLAVETAASIRKHGMEIEPAFRGSACTEYLDLLVQLTGLEGRFAGDPTRWLAPEASFVLARCIEPGFDGLAGPAKCLLANFDWAKAPKCALLLGRLAGCEARVTAEIEAELAGSPLVVAELQAVVRADLAAHSRAAAFSHPRLDEILSADRATRSPDAEDEDYAAFARKGLEQAAERVRRIHDREQPYVADKAFTVSEAGVIARLARVALKRDELWLPPLLDALFRGVSLAPTSAKSVPSQSVAIGLGHAVEAWPTPEAVETLRAVLADIRHAGVKKKLQRSLRGAEPRLGERPEVALRLPADRPIGKAQLKTLTRALEAGFASGMQLAYEDWRTRLAEHPQARGLAASLVWRMTDGAGAEISVLPAVELGRLILRDVSGAVATTASDCPVMLWHPLDATAAERSAWRDRITALRIRQPFKQVFREHYPLSAEEADGTATAMFAGHVVSVRSFVGLARRERWELGYCHLTRTFGQWIASLDVADNIYPGCGGSTNVGRLSIMASARWMAPSAPLSEVPAVTLSEILRAVDLLVSVGGFALEDDAWDSNRRVRLWRMAENPLGAMAEMRRQALERALHRMDGMELLAFDPRHLRLGPYAIHLATGRITRDGEPVTVDLPERNLAAVPWLPYDEKLLETICHTAIEIVRRVACETAAR